MRKLEKVVNNNLNIVRKTGGREIQEKVGNVVSSVDKIRNNTRVVGVSKGVTLNMGDYESMRIDVWLSDFVKDGESIESAEQRVASMVDNCLDKECSKLRKD